MYERKRRIPKTSNLSLLALLAAVTMLLSGAQTKAQCPTSTFTGGLNVPEKIILTPANNFLVSEAGTGPNTGRVSLINRSGARQTLLDTLPAGLSAPENSPDGPTGILLRDRTLYLAIGEGDSLMNGGPGTTVPNPNPSSPIFSSILVIQLSNDVDKIKSGFTLSFADQTALKSGSTVMLANTTGDTLTVKLLADFPDYVPDPRFPGDPNVRNSHPYALELIGDQLYVVDAGFNSVRRVNIQTGANDTLTTFAPIPNTDPPPPPVVEAVPTSIRLYNNQLLVTLFRGFPFPPGKAEVRRVDPGTGNNDLFISGLSSAIDVLPASIRGDGDAFLSLEFSANQLQGAPGRLQMWPTNTGTPIVIATCLITPTSMVRDPLTGDIFITQLGPGTIVRVRSAQIFVRQHYLDFLNREPDQAGLDYWTSQIEACGDNVQCLRTKRVDVSAAFFIEQEFQNTGFFIYRVRKATLGVRPTFAQYTSDRAQIGSGTDADKTNFTEAFVQRQEFLAVYPVGQSGANFIDALIATVKQSSGVDLASKRSELANEYIQGSTQAQSRARVIRKLVEYAEYKQAETNPSFVLAEYFGYLRRDPEEAGFNFWLNVLNNKEPNNYRGMVCSFFTSAEYQKRSFIFETEGNAACQ
ncbi:MAG: ScyD/ScyE family protein [Pyrinomonadaceae bacterium]